MGAILRGMMKLTGSKAMKGFARYSQCLNSSQQLVLVEGKLRDLAHWPRIP
jgi:hypothetical protein